MSFHLHPDLVRDTLPVGTFPLCEVRIMDDTTYPWFVLVPQRAGIVETIDLSPEDYCQLWKESRMFSTAIMAAYQGHKLNVAALGNMTPQLHIHHIVRYCDDPAWPGPIWGKVPMEPHSPEALGKRLDALLPRLPEGIVPS